MARRFTFARGNSFDQHWCTYKADASVIAQQSSGDSTSATSVTFTAASWLLLRRHGHRMSVSLRTRFSTDQVLQPIIDRCGSPPVVVGGQCNQPLASDISNVVSLVSLRRAQTGPCPLLPCQNSSQNNLSLRIFSRVPHAMSSPAYFRAKHCLHTVTCSDELG
jgi:hypothetical protein